ncbi:unnamed protein product [Adineta ricciae]|uniref:Uncharacterized protein n=1 Tax=Adineta ricciae TaxID=249248 RepID=A0A815H184_ADIRI|nr:unnamed protein product [Adineta ricciae]
MDQISITLKSYQKDFCFLKPPARDVIDIYRVPELHAALGGAPGLLVATTSCCQASPLSMGHKTLLANEKDQEQCINARKTTFFGGWNVRSCFRMAKKQLIIKQLQRHRIQVAALSETAIYDTGVSTVGEYTMVHSGLTSENRTRSAHGVAICLGKQATMAWKNIGAFWKAVNERIVMVRLQGTAVNVTIIAVYSPVNPNGNKTAATASDKFYTDLQQTLSTVPSKDLLLIMGDFNARIGKQQNYTSNNVVGPHTTDHINENGQRLVDFCAANDLIITNTFFQHKPIHQTTWMHPGHKKWHTLDYTLVNRETILSNGTFELNCPNGITLDNEGFVFVVDSNNHRIIGQNSNGFHCLVGCNQSAGSNRNQLSSPSNLQFDLFGNIFVVDQQNHRIQKFDLIIIAGQWKSTGNMAVARYGHTASILSNGKVLITGGYNGGYLNSAELYDPSTGNWTTTRTMSVARYGHTASILSNGKVLVTGGGYLNSAELYDPSTGNWTTTGTMSVARYGHTASLLSNGKVLVTGGDTGSGYLNSAELYDPSTGNWTTTGKMSVARYQHTASLLSNKTILVTGGCCSLNSAELY